MDKTHNKQNKKKMISTKYKVQNIEIQNTKQRSTIIKHKTYKTQNIEIPSQNIAESAWLWDSWSMK